MKVGSLILMLVWLVGSVHAQTGQLRGRIFDSKTSEPLPFAHVFVNLTTLGTTSDDQGNYVLKGLPPGTHELVFSFIGYSSYITKVTIQHDQETRQDIRLIPLDKELETVVISGTRDKEWEKQLKRFEKIFLGTTRFSGATAIKNPWVLEFKETTVNNVHLFTATASQPIEIVNSALGYRIDYHLKTFAYTSEGYNIVGQVRFEELIPQSELQVKTWGDNRSLAYYGSFRHLITAILADRVEDEGFQIYTDKSGYENTSIRTANFKSQIDKTVELHSTKNTVVPGRIGEFLIPVKQRWEVHYVRARAIQKTYSDVDNPVSWIQVNGGTVRATADGIVLNPANVILSGAMNEARLADMLPYNYSPGAAPAIAIETPEVRMLKRLEEGVYLRTDKGYYYPGETIWVKAFMNYRTPELMDSLSKVLYLDLIGPEQKLVSTKVVFINGGSAAGSFRLSPELAPGMYALRGYTQWMMNYGATVISTRSIPVLPQDERPVVAGDSGLQLITPELKLTTTRTTYQPREKIKLDFELRDTEGVPIPGEFSISVTDVNQVIPVPGPGILEGFALTEPDPASWRHTVPVEAGISVAGQYFNTKGKPAKVNLAVVQNRYERLIPVETDGQGNFFVTGLHFYDSAELGFQLLATKKSTGSVVLKKFSEPALIKPVERIVTEKSKPVSVWSSAEVPESRILSEVMVEEKMLPVELKNKEQVPKTYGRADYTLTHEEIVASSRSSLVDVLVGRIPGLIVTGGSLRLGGASNFMGPATTEPLLIIDGVQLSGTGDSNYNRLKQINPEIVERVDVIKYTGAALYGSRGSNGVIIVNTKDGIAEGTNVNTAFFQTAFVRGYSAPILFNAPDYSTTHNVATDTRATIHWEPALRTDEVFKSISVSFYAADLETTYRIEVEGVTDFGDPVRGLFFIEIKK